MRLLALPAVLTLSLASAANVPTEHRPLAEIIPADAVVAAWVEDVDGLRETLEGNAWYRFFLDEEIQATWRGFAGWFEEQVEAELGDESGATDADDEDGLDPLEVWRAIHGSFAAFVSPTDDPDVPAYGVLVRPGDDRDAFDGLYDGVVARCEETWVSSAADYAGVDLLVFEGSADDGPEFSVFFELADLNARVGGPDRETALAIAHGVIDRWQTGQGEGIEASQLLAEARQKTAIQGAIEAFVDVQGLLDWAMQGEEEDEEWQKIEELLRLRDVHWVHARAGFGDGERLDKVVTFDVPEEGLLRELLSCMGPAPLELARLAPADSKSLNLYSVDLLRLADVILDAVREFDPTFEEEELAEMEMGLDLDLRDDLLAHVSGEFVQFTMDVPEAEWLAANPQVAWLDEAVSSKLPRIGQAVVGRLVDGAALEASLTRVLENMGMAPMIETEDFQGFSVRRMDMGGPQVAWAIAADRIVISTYPTALRAALRRVTEAGDRSIVDDPLFGPELKRNDRASFLGITRTAFVLRTWMQLAEIPFAMFGGMLGSGGPPPEMPDASIVDRYFKGTLVWAVELRDSLRIAMSTR